MTLEEKVIAYLKHCNKSLTEIEIVDDLAENGRYNFATFLELISDAMEFYKND